MKTVDLGFGTFEFHPDVVIATMCEGIHFDLEYNQVLNDAVIDYYGAQHNIGYISLRKNSYSVDPMVHRYNSKHNTLVSVGIVETRISDMSSVDLESKFFKPGKLKGFLTSQEAWVWTNLQLQEASQGFLPFYKVN
ncbi:hypothetical protein [Nonlabens xiamenensis]|uniref:hypothetical protein n=1 Tax=Nonlabens xiamenensis TaxID=2341043 RepID=UPI000F6117A8|nr:hypothetical protein [Nonlabens xiamenensis]